MLTQFGKMLSGTDTKDPPFALRASDLDNNFGLCYPRPVDGNNHPYRVDYGGKKEGWTLVGTKIFDVCENGQPVRYQFFAKKIAL